jgi:hypothetical protein
MIGAEWRKVRGRGLAYAVLVFGLLHGVAAVALLFAMGKASEQVQPGAAEGLDWLLAADVAVGLASFPVNGLVLLVLFAILWAEDLSIGTAAMILSRPVRRAEVFAAKAVLGIGVTFASISLAMGVAAVLGLAVFGTGGDASQFPIQASRWMADVDGTLPKLLRIGWGTVLATGIMLPALACAPLLTLAGSLLTLAADAGATAILWAWAQTDLASAQTAGTLKEWTFWSSRDLFGHHGTLTLLSEGTGDLGRTLGFSLVLLALALLVLQRRDIR